MYTKPEALARLNVLATKLTVIPNQTSALPPGIELVEKDVPILAAAISARCTHLVTGDNQHFGPLFGHTVEGVCILTPAQYLKRRQVNSSPK